MPASGDGPDLVTLVVRLCENPQQALTARGLLELGEAGMWLREWGALQHAESRRALACPSCDLDHEVELEFDAATGSYRYYCGSVGFAYVDADEVRDFRFDRGWLRDRLAEGLQIRRTRHRELVPDVLWDLGDAALGSRLWSAFLGRAVRLHFEDIHEALRTRGGKLPGLVLTSSMDVPWGVPLPHGHQFLPLGDALEARAGALGVVPDVVLGALRGRHTRQPKGQRGRSTNKGVVLDVFADRVRKRLTLSGVGAEAATIRDRILKEHPELEAMAVRTVENIIRAKHSVWRSERARRTK